jgi:hypothetical protein
MLPIRIQLNPVHSNIQQLTKTHINYDLLIFPYLHKFLGQCSCPYMSRDVPTCLVMSPHVSWCPYMSRASHHSWYTALNLHRVSVRCCLCRPFYHWKTRCSTYTLIYLCVLHDPPNERIMCLSESLLVFINDIPP